MEIRTVETFLKIVQTNSFSKSAEELNYAQSTVTTQIKVLEEELGIALFDRIGNRIRLTKDGEKFVQYALEITSLTKHAKQLFLEKDEMTGTLLIGVVDSLCTGLLPEVIKKFTVNYPQIRFILSIASSTEIEQMLESGKIDLGIYLGLQQPEDKMLSIHTVVHNLAAFCSPVNVLAAKAEVSLRQLSGQKLILTEKECQYHKAILKLFTSQGLTPDIVLETGNTEIIKRFVNANVGIAFLPQITIEKERKDGILHLLKPDFEVPKVYVILAVNKYVTHNKAVDVFLAMYQEGLKVETMEGR